MVLIYASCGRSYYNIVFRNGDNHKLGLTQSLKEVRNMEPKYKISYIEGLKRWFYHKKNRGREDPLSSPEMTSIKKRLSR